MDAPHAMPLWQAGLSGLLGLLYVFAGYRTMRFTARLSSALLFTGLGMLFVSQVQNPWIVLAVMVGSGVLGYLLGNALYFVTVALYGAAAGVVLAAVACTAAGSPLGWAAGAGGAVTGAVLAVLLQRPVGILATSVTGAALAMMSLQSALLATGVHAPNRFVWGYVALLLGLAVLGCAVQAKTTRDLPAAIGTPATPRASNPA